jgi:hypothetical protein
MRAKTLHHDWRKHDPQTGVTLIRWDAQKKKQKPAPARKRSPYSGRKQAPRRPPRRR